MNKLFVIGYLLLGLLTGMASAPPAAPCRLLHTIAVGGEGSWDFMTVDAEGQRLYVAHSTQVEVIDLKTRKVVGAILNTPGVHGIAVVPAAGRGYISCGKTNACVVFDLKTLKSIATIPTGLKPDAVLYDAFSKRVVVFSNNGGNSTVLDALTSKVLGTAELNGDAEVGVTDGKGSIFVNLEDKSEVIEVNAKTLAVKQRHALAPGEEPTGLAYDPKTNRLFSGCANGKLVVTNSQTGKQIAVLPIGKGVDGVAFDPATRNIISTNGGDGTLTVIHEDTPNTYTVVATVPTARGARTVAQNPKNQHIFTCTADLGPIPAATAENPKPRPSIVPGTFRVLEYGR